MKEKINIKLNKKSGLKYSLISGDKNKIHINENFGHNSIYGETICHGTNVIIEFLKKINFEKNNDVDNLNININFLKHTSYNQLIEIESSVNTKGSVYRFYQNNKKIIILKVKFCNNYISNYQNFKSMWEILFQEEILL